MSNLIGMISPAVASRALTEIQEGEKITVNQLIGLHGSKHIPRMQPAESRAYSQNHG